MICGDCNFTPASAEHARICDAFDDGTPPFVDAWTHHHRGAAHPQSWGVHDDHPKICCDFAFVTRDLADRLTRLDIVADTDASDHQPVRLTLDSH